MDQHPFEMAWKDKLESFQLHLLSPVKEEKEELDSHNFIFVLINTAVAGGGVL